MPWKFPIRPWLLRAFCINRKGSIAALFAFYAPVGLLCLGFVIDLMMLHVEKRDAQGVVDIAAIMAAEYVTDQETVARNILAINGLETISRIELGKLSGEDAEEKIKTYTEVEVEPGRYEADANKSASERFTAGAAPYNAARVTISKQGSYYFLDNMFDAPRIDVAATAARQEVAAFSVGSRLASLDGGIVNELLSQLTGSSISLNVLDYNALATTRIDLFDYLDALASRVNINSGAYEDVLDNEPTLTDVAGALIDVSGYGPAATALYEIKAASSGVSDRIDLSKVIDLGPMGKVALGEADATGFPVSASIFDILFANAVVANGENLLNLDLAASFPSLASIEATIQLGEQLQSSPWLSIGQYGETVSNAQARIFIEAAIGGEGVLSSVEVRLPVYFEIARAQGKLKSVNCPGGVLEDTIVTLEGASSVADAWIGDVDMSSKKRGDAAAKKAKLISAPGLVAFGEAHIGTGVEQGELLEFTWADISNGVVKSTETENTAAKLLASLLGDVDVETKVLGLGLTTNGLADSALRQSLEALATPVSQLVDDVTAAIGLSVGEGDFIVNGVKCDRAVLVE